MPSYTVAYDFFSGAVLGVDRSDGARVLKGGAGWDDFLVWNAQQSPPLDVATPGAGQSAGDKTAAARSAAKAVIDSDTTDRGKLHRAVAAVLVDEINLVRQWTVAFKAAVAAATSLANLQTRVAALDTLGDRTLTQAKTAIDAKIDGGTVD